MLPHEDPVNLAPEQHGQFGQAWRAPEGTIQPFPHLTGLWVVEAPSAHPIWHSYMLTLCDLKPDKEIPAIIALPGATHEFMLHALDARTPREALLLAGQTHAVLHPANFVGQFIAPDDGSACARINAVVQEICDGLVSPDTDYRRQWVERFGDHCLQDPASLLGTRH